jgi:hypothetical protein
LIVSQSSLKKKCRAFKSTSTSLFTGGTFYLNSPDFIARKCLVTQIMWLADMIVQIILQKFMCEENIQVALKGMW